jgi:hypothetical protein
MEELDQSSLRTLVKHTETAHDRDRTWAPYRDRVMSRVPTEELASQMLMEPPHSLQYSKGQVL